MSTRSGYEDVGEPIRDPEGVIAILSRRRSNGQLSVAVMKEFDRDGQTERTSFMQRRHIDAAIRVLTIARDEMDRMEDQTHASARATGSGR